MRAAFVWQAACTGMWRARGLTLASLTTLSVGLWLLGLLAMGLLAARQLADAWVQGGHLTAGLEAGLTAEEQGAVRARVAALSGVAEVQLLTPDDQLALLAADASAPSLAGVDASLLPASLRIVPHAATVRAGGVATLAAEVAKVSGTHDVDYGAAPLAQLHRVVDGVTVAVTAASAALLFALTFMVMNTIRLMLFNRRDELRIQKLIGATDLFVQAPFWLEGLLWGVAAGALAAVATLAGEHACFDSLVRLGQLLEVPTPRLSARPLLAAQVALGGAIGLLGSTLASRAFLRDDAAGPS